MNKYLCRLRRTSSFMTQLYLEAESLQRLGEYIPKPEILMLKNGEFWFVLGSSDSLMPELVGTTVRYSTNPRQYTTPYRGRSAKYWNMGHLDVV